MRVFAVHVVREDDYLEDVRVYRFAIKSGVNDVLHSDVGKGGGSDAQSFAVVGGFRRDVKGDPAVWTVERDRTHLL